MGRAETEMEIEMEMEIGSGLGLAGLGWAGIWRPGGRAALRRQGSTRLSANVPRIQAIASKWTHVEPVSCCRYLVKR